MYGIPVSDASVSYGVLLATGYVTVLLALAVTTFRRREFF